MWDTIFEILLLAGLASLGSVLWLRDRFREPTIPEYVTVKEYPPGCLCIRGALLDNPRCPHHPET